MNNPKLNPIQVIFLIFEIIFVIAILSTIIILNSQKSEPTTSEFTETSNLTNLDVPENIINILQISLSNTILLNTSNQATFNTSDLNIRENSTTLLTNNQDHYLNFIADIPSLNQSYRVVYEWTDGKTTGLGNPSIFCLPKSEQIYQNTNCKDTFSNHGSEYIISQKLKNQSFTNFSVGTTNYNSDNFQIFIFPKDNTNAEAATTELKNYIKSLGFNPELYKYTVSTNPADPDKLYYQNNS